jgi:LAO/AO transport system kinase
MEPATRRKLARALSAVENRAEGWRDVLAKSYRRRGGVVVGVTGPPGSGKSTLIDAMAAEWAEAGERVAVLAIDPSSPFSGGAVLGDRVRMRRSEEHPNVFIRSMSARGHPGGLNEAAVDLCAVLAGFGVDRVIVETVGAGQNEIDVAFVADCVVVLSVPGLGDSLQASKAGLLEIGDVHVVNKSDLSGAAIVARDLASMLALAFPGQPGANAAAKNAPSPPLTSRPHLEARFGSPLSETGCWHPPVLLAAATAADGARQVNETVDCCLAWLRGSGRGHCRARERAAIHLREIVKRQLFARFLAAAPQAGPESFASFADAVADARADPYLLADRLVAAAAGERMALREAEA